MKSTRTQDSSTWSVDDDDLAIARDPDGDVRGLLDRGGALAAIQLLMQRHGAAVYRYCRESLADAAAAGDAHRQVFISAFRYRHTLSRSLSVRAWLFALARRCVLDAGATAAAVLAQPSAAEDPVAPIDSLDDAGLTESVGACMRALDAPTRALILLRYQQGLSAAEVSAICDEPPGSVARRLRSGLAELWQRIECGEADPGADLRGRLPGLLLNDHR